MKEVEVTATLRPAAGDWTTLSKSSCGTIEAVYQHPLSHNLKWSSVVALVEHLGRVEQKSHNEIALSIGGEHHIVRRPQGNDLTATEVMTIRHMLSRAGWAPQHTALKASSAIEPTSSSKG